MRSLLRDVFAAPRLTWAELELKLLRLAVAGVVIVIVVPGWARLWFAPIAVWDAVDWIRVKRARREAEIWRCPRCGDRQPTQPRTCFGCGLPTRNGTRRS